MTYRAGVRRARIQSPWGKARHVARAAAIVTGSGAAGSILAAAIVLGGGAATAIGAGWLVLGLAAAPFLLGGGGAKLVPARKGQGAESVLVDAGLAPVTMAEWRGEREEHPCRVVFSRTSLRSTVELALGTAPSFRIETFEPAPRKVGRVGSVGLRSERLEQAREVVQEALFAVRASQPEAHRMAISGRIIRVRVARAQWLEPIAGQHPYGPVLWALAYATELARALEARGEGLAPFE